jgi:hypothetical protein
VCKRSTYMAIFSDRITLLCFEGLLRFVSSPCKHGFSGCISTTSSQKGRKLQSIFLKLTLNRKSYLFSNKI